MPKVKNGYADAKRREILKAAWQSFMEKGYEKTTMREIAKRTDSTTGILYAYYKSKQEILNEMQIGIHNRIQNTLAEMNKKDSVREAFKGFFTYEFKWPSDNIARKNCRGMVGLLAEALRSKGVRKLMNASFRDIEEGSAALFEKGIQNGEIRSHVDPKALAGLFQALEWGLWMQIALVDGLDIQASIENMIKILMGDIWRNPKVDDRKKG